LKATMAQVAELAGVSKTLVSRYLNGKPGVSAESAARIQDAIERLKYRLPTAGEARVIALILDDVSLFHGELIRACSDVALENGYVLMVVDGFDDGAIKERAASILARGCVKGVIVYGSAAQDRRAIDTLTQAGIPLVLVENDLPDVKIEKILVDNFNAQYTITQYLIDRGFRDLRIIPWDVSTRAGTERLSGFLAALRDNALTPGNSYLYPPEKWGYASVFNIVKRLYEIDDLPEAFVCSGDTNAAYVLASCIQLGIPVPERVSVTGFDGVLSDRFFTLNARITTMRQPLREMGLCAAKRLLRHIDHPGTPPETSIFHARLVEGDTTSDLRRVSAEASVAATS